MPRDSRARECRASRSRDKVATYPPARGAIARRGPPRRTDRAVYDRRVRFRAGEKFLFRSAALVTACTKRDGDIRARARLPGTRPSALKIRGGPLAARRPPKLMDERALPVIIIINHGRNDGRTSGGGLCASPARLSKFICRRAIRNLNMQHGFYAPLCGRNEARPFSGGNSYFFSTFFLAVENY